MAKTSKKNHDKVETSDTSISESNVNNKFLEEIKNNPTEFYWTLVDHYGKTTLMRLGFILNDRITKKAIKNVIDQLAIRCNDYPIAMNTINYYLKELETDSLIESYINENEFTYVAKPKLLNDFIDAYNKIHNSPEYIMMFYVGTVDHDNPLNNKILLSTMADARSTYNGKIIFPTTEVTTLNRGTVIKPEIFKSVKFKEFIKKNLMITPLHRIAEFPPTDNSGFKGQLSSFNPNSAILNAVHTFFSTQGKKIGRFETNNTHEYTYQDLIKYPEQMYVKLRSFVIAELARFAHDSDNHDEEKKYLAKIGNKVDKDYFRIFLRANPNMNWNYEHVSGGR